jgi:hypothetical protein
MRGAHMKVDAVPIVVESKLAEGGFAIVYKVVSDDRRQRPMALKRQFINEDDQRHLDACRREYEIVVCLIVRHVVNEWAYSDRSVRTRIL